MMMNLQKKDKKFDGKQKLSRDRDISLEMVEKDQEKFKREFSPIKSGNPKHKSEMELYTTRNVKNLYDSRHKIIDLLNNYSKIKSEPIYRSKQAETEGRGLKILTPKKCFKDCQQLLHK